MGLIQNVEVQVWSVRVKSSSSFAACESRVSVFLKCLETHDSPVKGLEPARFESDNVPKKMEVVRLENGFSSNNCLD